MRHRYGYFRLAVSLLPASVASMWSAMIRDSPAAIICFTEVFEVDVIFLSSIARLGRVLNPDIFLVTPLFAELVVDEKSGRELFK